MGNSSRLFNHSCDPNLELRLVAAAGVSPVPRVVFFAKRDIAVGEELTWKYAGRTGDQSRSSALWSEARQRLSPSLPRIDLGRPRFPAGCAPFMSSPAVWTLRLRTAGGRYTHQRSGQRRCHCGASNCRGFL